MSHVHPAPPPAQLPGNPVFRPGVEPLSRVPPVLRSPVPGSTLPSQIPPVLRGPGSRIVDQAQGWISPAVSLLRPGASLVLEVQGVAAPITWQVIGQGYRSHLTLRPASRHQLMLTLAPGSTLDEIVFLRAESQVDGQRSGLASVRLMPEPLPVKEPDPVPGPREPGLLSRLLGFGVEEPVPVRR